MMRRNQDHQKRSSSGAVDLWEHACLLYHSYEWQSAADAFLQLELHTSDLEDKCIFAMNKGLIEARLGDLEAAISSFAKALEYNEGNPVAHFLLGLAHAHTQHHAKAKTQFEHCLKALDTNEREYQTCMNFFSIDALMVQENIDHMRSRLIATAAGHGRISHLRTRLHIIPAEVLFEPPSRSTRTPQRDSKSSTEKRLNFKEYEYSNGRIQDPKSRATQPLHVAGHDVKSLHLVEDAEKNLTIAPLSDTVNDVRSHKRLVPRDPRVQDGSIQELAQFLRHAGPSGDAKVTVDRKYMQRLLQGNRMDRTRLQSQVSPPRDDFESLLGLYTRASSIERRSIPTNIDTSVSDALTARQDDRSEHTITVRYERPIAGRERPLGSRWPTLESAQSWLRKEVQPLGPYELAASDQQSESAEAARGHSCGTVSHDDRDGHSPPSVVSSTEMFTIGKSRKRLP
jgi:tetratricopeptide (TPR) repeat protein